MLFTKRQRNTHLESPVIHNPRVYFKVAHQMVAVDALDIGGHLIDPVARQLAGWQSPVALVKVRSVGLILRATK